MRIATWNVNSIRARIAPVKDWLEANPVDVLLLQEIKTEEGGFPRFEFETMGYQALVAGQKSYNGVAILTRHPATEIQPHLPTFAQDPQARYIQAKIGPYTLASVYLPNGNPVGTEKYAYKLDWMARFTAYAKEVLAKEIPMIWGGDFNVLAEDRDAYDIKPYQNDALATPETRAAWQRLRNLGLTSAYRARHPNEDQAYTFWDYQAGAFQKNWGLRLDDFLLTPESAAHLTHCHPDPTPRSTEKASDHTPVVAVFGGGGGLVNLNESNSTRLSGPNM